RGGGEALAGGLAGPRVGEAGRHVGGAGVGDVAGEADGRARGARRRGAPDGGAGVEVLDREDRRAGDADGAVAVFHDQADRVAAVVVRREGEGGLRAGGEGGRAAVLGDGPGVGQRVAGVGVAGGAGERDRRALGGGRRDVDDAARRGAVAAAGDRDVGGELRHGANADGREDRARADGRRQGDQEAEQV